MSFQKIAILVLGIMGACVLASRASESVVKEFAGLEYPCPSGPGDVDRLGELNPDALKLLVALTNGACKYAAGDYSGSLAVLLPEAQLLGETVTADVAGEYQARLYWLLANVEVKTGDARKAAHYMAVAWAIDKASHSMLSDLTPEFVRDHNAIGTVASQSPNPSVSNARTPPPQILTQLATDEIVTSCGAGAGGSTFGGLFECVYTKRDYKAAEALGEALLASDKSATQKTIYEVANAFYHRGNDAKSLQYAKLGYSYLTVADKTICANSTKYCLELRTLLITLDPSYRSKFALEDRQIKAQAVEAARAAAAAAREAAKVVFSYSGSGIHHTETFTVNSEWELEWSYDCSNFGTRGNFAISVDGDVQTVAVNQLGDSDSGTEYFHQGGNIYLEINSECSWTVKVVNE